VTEKNTYRIYTQNFFHQFVVNIQTNNTGQNQDRIKHLPETDTEFFVTNYSTVLNFSDFENITGKISLAITRGPIFKKS